MLHIFGLTISSKLLQKLMISQEGKVKVKVEPSVSHSLQSSSKIAVWQSQSPKDFIWNIIICWSVIFLPRKPVLHVFNLLFVKHLLLKLERTQCDFSKDLLVLSHHIIDKISHNLTHICLKLEPIFLSSCTIKVFVIIYQLCLLLNLVQFSIFLRFSLAMHNQVIFWIPRLGLQKFLHAHTLTVACLLPAMLMDR